MKQANVTLAIEQLLLPDLPYYQQAQVAAALEQAFNRLWLEQGVPADFVGDALSLSIAKIEVDAGVPPEVMGTQIAQALYGQLGGQQQPTAVTKGSTI